VLLCATDRHRQSHRPSGGRLFAASTFLLAAAAIATRTARQRACDPSVAVKGTKNPRHLEQRHLRQ
jgi:hypothetical protein